MAIKTDLKIGDPVQVADYGLSILQRLAPKGAHPNNIGVVGEFADDYIIVHFPIGDEKMSEHSQAAPYKPSEITKLETIPDWLQKLI